MGDSQHFCRLPTYYFQPFYFFPQLENCSSYNSCAEMFQRIASKVAGARTMTTHYKLYLLPENLAVRYNITPRSLPYAGRMKTQTLPYAQKTKNFTTWKIQTNSKIISPY